MKKAKDTGKMTPAEIRQAAYGAITRELGASGLLRFMQDFSLGHGDYTKARHAFLPGGSVDEIAARIRAWEGAERSGISSPGKPTR